MDMTKQSEISNAQMQLLVVGKNEEDFNYLRDLLTKTGDGRLGLDHAHSPEEALERLAQTTYDLLLCDYKSGDGMALHLLHDLHKHGLGAPVIFLSDHVDEGAVEAAVKAGACECVQTSSLNEATITHAIRYAIDVYCKERQRQKAEDTLRKLWRAVEQSADLVIITDLSGVIEYVNPASKRSPDIRANRPSAGRRAYLNPDSSLLRFTRSYGKPFSRAACFVEFW